MAEAPGEVAFIMQSGTGKVHVEQVNGTDVIIALRGCGVIPDEMSLPDQQGRSASVVTLDECDEAALMAGADRYFR
jgi:CRP/FNR family cyclic AMP-dependent transcriptional regulator